MINNNTTKANLISGFLVFLIALPLCLGIAEASGFPPIAGIYTAVIGGLLVTFLSKAPSAIKGPAAGLIAIAMAAVDELGGGDPIKGYQLTLAVVVVSGAIQIILGLLKVGKLGAIFPTSVIRGMLAAIGVTIISKQIHIVFGVEPTAKSPMNLLAEIPNSIVHLNPKVTVIGILSLIILFIHPVFKQNLIKKFPAPLLVLLIAIPLGFLFHLSVEHAFILGGSEYNIIPTDLMVDLPDNFLSGITFPDFSQVFSGASIKYIVMFALVGSIESVLSAKAVDSLDPKGRDTNLNQDLVAVGVGNTIAGFIGGLPMISEIVRSSANINAGAKGRMSNFYHGLFLFLFVLLAAVVIKTIPNAALAAMLVYTGYVLASPKKAMEISSIGVDQLLQFLTTLVITLMTDLLVGVIAGIVLKIFLEFVYGVKPKNVFYLETKESESDETITIHIIGVATFLNYLKFKNILDDQAKSQRLVLDFSEATFVDHTFLSNIDGIQSKFQKEGGEISLIGFENHRHLSKHKLCSRRLVKS